MTDNIKPLITQIQVLLNKYGGNRLVADGLMGQKTYTACAAYQKEQASNPTLPITGKPEPRLARSLVVFRDQINLLYPHRDKKSDGWIGDTKHKSQISDHNSWIKDVDGTEVVSAFDLTHDMKHGVNCALIAERIKDDPRVKYVIWDKRIYNAGVALVWRTYTGANAHNLHMHVSVKSLKKYYDGEALWKVI